MNKRRRGSINSGRYAPIQRNDNRGKSRGTETARLLKECDRECAVEILRFPEPTRNATGDCVIRWFAYLLHPKVACWIILLTAMGTATFIARVDNCGSSFYIYEPVKGKIGYVKQGVKLITNASVDGLQQSCYTSDPDLEYMKKVYSTIQAVMVFMLTMTLGSGIAKYKEEIRLFEALSGDVKALAMFLVHMSVDKEKYELATDEKLVFKNDVRFMFERVRKLLGVIAPVARVVLRGQRLKKGCINHIFCKKETVATRDELETYKNYQVYKKWEKNFFPFKMCPCNKRWLCGYWGDLYSERYGCNCNWWFRGLFNPVFGERHKRVKIYWSESKKWDEIINLHYAPEPGNQEKMRCLMKWDERQAWEKGWCDKPKAKQSELMGDYKKWANKLREHIPNETDISLYNKISLVQNNSQFDLFETVMTVLVDELSKIAESKLGFGEDEGAAVRSEIYAKWDSIYASWGSMSSIKSYSEPTIVHLFRFSLLMAYALLMPYMYLDELKDSVERYLAFVFLEVFVFAFLWYTAYTVRNPFQDVVCMRGVKPIASATQLQVLNLIEQAVVYDQKDYLDDIVLQELFKKKKDKFRRRSMAFGSQPPMDF